MFRTYEPARDRLVAVKAFRLDLTPEQAHALAAELQHVVDAGLDHPSIVRPIAAGVEGTVAYAATEYVAAESLDIALRHYAPATLEKVLPFITQLAGAIDFARVAGVGHGALHPRDIFISPDEARATGFGVVQALEHVGARAPIRRPYTAPERVDGSEWGVGADVYSLAAIAYELLTARRPAGAGSAISAADFPSEHADLVAAAIAHGLAEDPRARHQSALSFAASLEAAARGERTSAREPLLAVPVVPAEPLAEMRPDGATYLDIPQEPAHDLVIEPFDEIERPPEREVDEIQLRDERGEQPPISEPAELAPPAAAPAIEMPVRSEPRYNEPPFGEAVPADEQPPAGEEHIEQPPVGPAGHEFVGTLEREPLLFDTPEAPSDAESPSEAEAQSEPGPRREPPPEPPDEPERPPVPEPIPEPEPWREPDWRPENHEQRESEREVAPVPRFDAGASEGAARREPESYARTQPQSPHARSEVVSRREPPADRQRPVLLPVALTLLLGLFVGFLAGYLVGSRDRTGGAPQSASARPDTREPAAPRGAAPAQRPAVPVPVPEQKPAAPRAAAPQLQAPQERRTSAPADGRLAVRSTPAGAQVFVNGRRRGPTPLVIRNLTAGTYTVRVERQGYTPETRRVTVGGNGARDIAVTLKRAAPERPPTPTTFVGSMYLDSRPRGAKVFVDGKPMGETPMQIPEIRAGAHAVRFELAGHRPWSTSATVVAGEIARVTGSLERQP